MRFTSALATAVFCIGAPSAAAEVNVIDFENYDVGSTGPFTTAEGNPFSIRGGVIQHDPTVGIGNYLQFFERRGFSGTRIMAVRVDEVTAHFPRILFFDVRSETGGKFVHQLRHPHDQLYIPLEAGVWTRIPINYNLVGNTTFYVQFGGRLSLDNFAFEDRFVNVPEPSTWALLLLGFGAVGTALRRARRPIARLAHGKGN